MDPLFPVYVLILLICHGLLWLRGMEKKLKRRTLCREGCMVEVLLRNGVFPISLWIQ